MSSIELIKIKTVEEMTTLSRATIYRLMKKKTFPEGKMITNNRRVWVREEVEFWIAQRLS